MVLLNVNCVATRTLGFHTQAASLLLWAATLRAVAGDGEAGELAGSCYDMQVSSANATIDYTKSAGPTSTTFEFLVRSTRGMLYMLTHCKLT